MMISATGLVVIARDLWSRWRDKFIHFYLFWNFFFWPIWDIVSRINLALGAWLIAMCFKRPKINCAEVGVGPFFKKKCLVSYTLVQPNPPFFISNIFWEKSLLKIEFQFEKKKPRDQLIALKILSKQFFPLSIPKTKYKLWPATSSCSWKGRWASV